MTRAPIVFLFNSPLSSGCDYVVQTMRIVSRTHPVYGIAMGDIISFTKWIGSGDRWIVRHQDGAVIVRPVSVLPGIRFRLVRLSAYMITSLILRILVDLRYRNPRKILWFFEPFHLPHILPVFTGYVTAYDCVDYYPGFHKLANIEHEIMMRKVNFIFANSPPLANALQKVRPDVVAVPLGFNEILFRNYKQKKLSFKKKSIAIGYIGGISHRIDFQLLERVIKRMPTAQFVLVGPYEPNVFDVADDVAFFMTRLLRFRNVQWVPGVNKDKIPNVLSRFDIGIIPYKTDRSFNRYSYPMKVLEYFAVGVPVISTDIYAIRRYSSLGLVGIVKDANDFYDETNEIIQRGWSTRLQHKQRQIAVSQSWEKKIQAILSVISSDVDGHRRIQQ